MKKIVLIILLFPFFNGLSQNLQKKEIVQLNKLNIRTETLNLNDINIQNDLNNILKLDKKRRTNKIVGIILTSSSVVCMIAGGTLINKDQPITDVLGGIMITGGVVYGGVSIPFWTSSRKRKKERNELIKIFNK